MMALYALGDPLGVAYVQRQSDNQKRRNKIKREEIKKQKSEAYAALKEAAQKGCEVSRLKIEDRRKRNSKASAKWRAKNKNYRKEHYEKNKDSHSKYGKEYRSKPENKEKTSKRRKERFNEDINFRISITMRSRLSMAVKTNSKTGSAVRDLGCSIEEFKLYIEAKFEPWMTWDNFGVYKVGGERKWHLDHIKPLASFDLTDDEQLKEAVNYKNYQPLCAIENIKKGAKSLDT